MLKGRGMASKANQQRTSRRTESSGIWRHGRRWFIAGGFAGAIALLAALTFALTGPDATERTVDVGAAPVSAEPAPDVTLATLDGDFRLSENRGEVLLLYFAFPG